MPTYGRSFLFKNSRTLIHVINQVLVQDYCQTQRRNPPLIYFFDGNVLSWSTLVIRVAVFGTKWQGLKFFIFLPKTAMTLNDIGMVFGRGWLAILRLQPHR